MIFVNSNYEDFASNEAMNHDFGLKPASRIKTFVFRFVSVAAK